MINKPLLVLLLGVISLLFGVIKVKQLKNKGDDFLKSESGRHQRLNTYSLFLAGFVLVVMGFFLGL